MGTALAKLRPFNLVAGLLHLVSFAAILFLANDASLPVTATYLFGWLQERYTTPGDGRVDS